MGQSSGPSYEQPPVAPMPVAPLGYDSRPYRGRPGIITAIGIISIIVGILSGLASLSGLMMPIGMLAMSRTPMPVAPTATVTTTPQPIVSGGMIVTPQEDGLAPQARTIVMNEITRRQPMNPKRIRQLDELLAQAGKQMFPFAGESVDPKMIDANISDRGTLPAVRGEMGPQYFVTGTGRVEVYDDHAVYRPDGSAEYLSVMVTEPSAEGYHAVGTMQVGPPTTVTSTTPPGGMMFPRINTTAATLVIIESSLSAILAIYLFVIGIMVLNDSRLGAKLHWMYVIVKLPLIALSVGAGIWMWQSFMSSVMSNLTTTSPAPPMYASAVWPVMGAVFALMYPIALIFVLMSRTVKEYYRPVDR